MASPKIELRSTTELLAFRSVVDLPFVHRHAIDPAAVLAISQATRPGDLTVKNVVVVDGLAALAHTSRDSFYRADDFALALGPSLRQAAATRQLLWLTAVPKADIPTIQDILGADIVHDVSLPHAESTLNDGAAGEDTLVPIALSPTQLLESWASGSEPEQALLARLLAGTDTLVMNRRMLGALRSVGTDLIERRSIWRFLFNPKVIAYLVILVYSSLRALPVVFVPGFKGNIWVLWAIDITTAIPYTWGIVEMVAGATLLRRMIGLAVTIITFISPYIYFWLNGDNYPAWIHFVVAGLVIAAIVTEYLRILRDKAVAFTLARRASNSDRLE